MGCATDTVQLLTMKKEVLIAIIIGFGIGLVATLGIHFARRGTNANIQTLAETPIPNPVAEMAASNHAIALTSPAQNSIISTDSTPVTGRTSANAVVTIVSPEEEQVVLADESGNFTTSILLQAGTNTIKAISYNSQGEEAIALIDLIYTTATPEGDVQAETESETENEE